MKLLKLQDEITQSHVGKRKKNRTAIQIHISHRNIDVSIIFLMLIYKLDYESQMRNTQDIMGY